MHVMFIHPNFPAQFGHIAAHLTTQLGWKATFVTSIDTTSLQLPFDHINYRVHDGPQPKVFYNPDNVQELFNHAAAIYKGLRGVPKLRPDLVVGHMSYGTMLYLRNLYQCPFVGYFELLPPPFWSDAMVLRKEFPPPEGVRLFNATYHTLTYLHLHFCDAGYTPTWFQLSTAPTELQHKLKVIFDGVDTQLFQRKPLPRPFEFRGLTIRPETKVVTYVSRGLESARGFDLFMKAAKQIEKTVPDVLFLIAGLERTNYGHEQHHIGNQSFKQWVLSQDSYDPAKYHFLGLIPVTDLVALYNLSNVHFYLTVPYVLSWSMVQAMSSGCAIVGSDTAPVQEAIDNGKQGLLADFYDVDGMAERAIRLLRDPEETRMLGESARARVLERYEAGKCINELVKFFRTFENRAVDSLFASFGGGT
jgi:glycosyltransferase involved in cell wall biosynthesis